MTPPKILLIGAADRPEFLDARRVLEKSAEVRSVANFEAGIAALEEPSNPDVIVVAQSYPGEFASTHVDRIRRIAPLVRIVALLGTWCEGEMRSGKPWPGVIRLYWHQAPERFRRELACIARASASNWSLPFTATEDERLLATADEPPLRRNGLIVIWTRSADMQAWLSDACIAMGFSTVWLYPSRPAPVHGASAAIFDSCRVDPGDVASLSRLTKSLSPAPVIVLMDSPRIEEVHARRAAGAVEVMSKPLQIEDLHACLERAVPAL